MTQPTEGVFMAPDEVVTDVQQQVASYFSALRQHRTPADATRDLVDGQDVFLSTFFADQALQATKDGINSATELPVLEKGDVTVNVLSFSADGQSALVSVEKRGFVSKFYAKPRLTNWIQRRQADEDVRMQVRYSIADKRWRVTDVVETVALRRTRTANSTTRAPVTRQRVVRPAAPTAVPTPVADTVAPAVQPVTSDNAPEAPVSPPNASVVVP
jgi:hypothetical protein